MLTNSISVISVLILFKSHPRIIMYVFLPKQAVTKIPPALATCISQTNFLHYHFFWVNKTVQLNSSRSRPDHHHITGHCKAISLLPKFAHTINRVLRQLLIPLSKHLHSCLLNIDTNNIILKLLGFFVLQPRTFKGTCNRVRICKSLFNLFSSHPFGSYVG